MRERKLRSAAESLLRLRGSLMSYIYNIYKTEWSSQEQIDNANLLLTQHRLKLEWNQMVWSVNNLGCGTAGSNGASGSYSGPEVRFEEKRFCGVLLVVQSSGTPFLGTWPSRTRVKAHDARERGSNRRFRLN